MTGANAEGREGLKHGDVLNGETCGRSSYLVRVRDSKLRARCAEARKKRKEAKA